MHLIRLLFRGNNLTCSLYTDFGDNAVWTGQLNSPSNAGVWNTSVWGNFLWGGQSEEAYSTSYPRKLGRAFKVRIDETSTVTYSRPAILGTGASLTTGAWALYGIDTQYAPLGLS
jgi:hypothetical protein